MRYDFILDDRGNPEVPDPHDLTIVPKEGSECVVIDPASECFSTAVAEAYASEITALNEFLLDHPQLLFMRWLSGHQIGRKDTLVFTHTVIEGRVGELKKTILDTQRRFIEIGEGMFMVGGITLTPHHMLTRYGMLSYELDIAYYLLTDKEADGQLNAIVRKFFIDQLLETL